MNSLLTNPTLNERAGVATSSFNIAVLYESSSACKRAKAFSDQLATGIAADRCVNLNQWNFRFLGRRDVRNAAASAAVVADMVIFSMSGKNPLPLQVERWVEMWTWLIDGRKPMVVALFETGDPASVRIGAYLQRGAVSKGLKFLRQMDGNH